MPEQTPREKIEAWLALKRWPLESQQAERIVRAALEIIDAEHYSAHKYKDICSCPSDEWPCAEKRAHESRLWRAISGEGADAD